MRFMRDFAAFWEGFKIDFKVRAADVADAQIIAEIEKECILSPWTKEMIQNDISLDYTLYLAAERDGELIGFIGASIILDTADITNVAVIPEHRRCGAGYALVSKMMEELHKRSVSEVFLEVRKSGLPAIALYRSCGFEQISARNAYYRNPTEDALVMKRAL